MSQSGRSVHGATPLSTATLASLGGRLPVPQYDRQRVTVGVVHIGVGGFHRSHQAVYHDRMIAEHDALEWGICGVGVLPADRRMNEVLTAQDGLYTLVVKHPDGRYELRVIGALLEHLFAPGDPERVVERMAAETTRIVSLTITEGGYSVDDENRTFDPGRADIARDLVPGAPPQTAFGIVTEALVRRRRRGLDPFAVLSCHNLVDNGDIARTAFSSFARVQDPDRKAKPPIRRGSTRRSRHVPGTPLSSRVPDSAKPQPEPTASWDARSRRARRGGRPECRRPGLCLARRESSCRDDGSHFQQSPRRAAAGRVSLIAARKVMKRWSPASEGE